MATLTLLPVCVHRQAKWLLQPLTTSALACQVQLQLAAVAQLADSFPQLLLQVLQVALQLISLARPGGRLQRLPLLVGCPLSAAEHMVLLAGGSQACRLHTP